MDQIEGKILKDYKTSFEYIDLNKAANELVVKISLKQEFIFSDGLDSGFRDDIIITFELNNRMNTSEMGPIYSISNISSNTLASQLTFDQFLERAVENINTDVKNSIYDEIRTSNNQINNEVITAWQPYYYDGLAAANYAYKYALDYNDNYTWFTVDCTNFASQALYAGGIPMQYTNDTVNNYKEWYYRDHILYSGSWVNVDGLYGAMQSKTMWIELKSSSLGLELGDIIQYDRDSDNDWNHTAIVTKIDSITKTRYVSYHSTDRRNVTWDFYKNAYTNCGVRFIHMTR